MLVLKGNMMNFDVVCKNILDLNSISRITLLNLMEEFSDVNIDYGDIFLQDSFYEEFCLENNSLINNSLKFIQGVGVRVISQNKTGFSHSNNINLDSIYNSIKKCKGILKKNCFSKKKKIVIRDNFYNNQVYSCKPCIDVNLGREKVEFLFNLYNIIKKKDRRINYISLKFINNLEYVLILSTDGIFAADIRPLIYLSIKVHIESNHNKGIGISGGGGRYSFHEFLSQQYQNISLTEYWAEKAAVMSINNLNAVYPPAGKMPIVMGPGLTGILLHEAVGHGLEGDFNRKGISLFKNLIGKKVASDLCTIVDDGTIKQNRGSLNIDDEGVFSKKTVLIKHGILKSYMLDKLNARLMGLHTTGNARRMSYAHLPIPRMTNTFLMPHKYDYNDIISTVKYGLYIVSLSGGQVDISSGNFVFNVLESFLIKNGKLNVPLKGVTLIGSSIEIMKKITMIGSDFEFDSGVGTCFKDGQGIPVGVGQPTIKIDDMIVGGVNF